MSENPRALQSPPFSSHASGGGTNAPSQSFQTCHLQNVMMGWCYCFLFFSSLSRLTSRLCPFSLPVITLTCFTCILITFCLSHMSFQIKYFLILGMYLWFYVYFFKIDVILKNHHTQKKKTIKSTVSQPVRKPPID